MNTPVALVFFKRPDTLARVLNVVRQVRPSTLFVIADGPRADHPDDALAVTNARALIEQIDWDCEIHKNYAETNLGNKRRVESGLDWVFAHTDRAIILEDDCVPHPTFFRFCAELLERYVDEPRVMGISGNNFQAPGDSPYSYHFSRYPLVWGWATWRRAWAHDDPDMRAWQSLRSGGWLSTQFDNVLAMRYWDYHFQQTSERRHTWDYAWFYSTLLHNGLHIMPRVNLVSNIGFAPDAFNTRNVNDAHANVPALPMEFPLHHPPAVERHLAADIMTEETVHSGKDFSRALFDAIRLHLRTPRIP